MVSSLRVAFVLVLTICFAASASAAPIVSSQFSIGYGFSAAGGGVGGWSTNEAIGANTPMIQGDFAFTPVVTGGQFDGAGTSFPSRVLTSGGGFTGVSIGYSNQPGFQAAISGAYLGTLPAGSNYRLKLNIDQVSIYGLAFTNFVAGDENLSFVETTPSNPGNSASLLLTPTGAYTTASAYTQLIWDPTDFEELGLSVVRTFTLASDDLRAIDGFEIIGTVELLFDPIPPAPEPSSLLLFGMGGIGLMSLRRCHCNVDRQSSGS